MATPAGFTDEAELVEQKQCENFKILVGKGKEKDIDELDDTNGKYNLDKIRNVVSGSYMRAMRELDMWGIKISTITLNCKLLIPVNMYTFAKYVELDMDGIVGVEYGPRDDKATNRSIVPIKKKKANKKSFLNQVTVRANRKGARTGKYMNIKIFRNGTLQLTGCKNMDDFYDIAVLIMRKLAAGRIIVKGGVKKKVRFVPKGTKISTGSSETSRDAVLDICDPKIRLINTNFSIDYNIDRKKFADILHENHKINTTDKKFGHIDCKYNQSSGHSGVHIKHHGKYTSIDNKKSCTHIFVFRTGSIIMTGAKNLPQIIDAYHYIVSILNHYKNAIRIVYLDPTAVNKKVDEYLESMAATASTPPTTTKSSKKGIMDII